MFVTQKKIRRLKLKHKDHVLRAEAARDMMYEDLRYAASNKDCETLTFDLLKSLPLPRIPTNIVYYKRQLQFYNLRIYSGKETVVFCYTWTENMAGRGAQEIGSCIRKHLLTYCQNIENLILWSDSCDGQIQNIKMMIILKMYFEELPHLETVTCKYLFSGHSMLPNDSDFGDMEYSFKYNP